MARTIAPFLVASFLIATAWLRLEQGSFPLGDVLTMIVLAALPTAAVFLRRSRLVVGLVLAASAFVAASATTGVPLADVGPRDGREFFAPLLDALRDGFLEYYDTRLPFNRVDFPLMHALLLLAVFGFTALAGMLASARRPIAAAATLLVALGWPATLMPGDRPLLTGALALAGVLALLFVLRSERSPARGLAQATAAGLVLVVVATLASTSDAVAKGGFLSWQGWDPYDKPEDPVNVRYVWNANYEGIRFPKEKTVVLKVRVPGPRRSLYWRATTLDDYTGIVWRENLEFVAADTFEEIDVAALDPLLPEAARTRENWVRQDVTVEALAENRLIGSAQAVRWEPGTSSPARLASNGAVVFEDALRQGQRYSVWSYVPQASPKALRAAGAEYPAEVARYLRALPAEDLEPLPAFGAPDRDAYMRGFFAREAYLDDHRSLYNVALSVTGEARSPYEAAVILEAWFRGSQGRFVYDESPPDPGVEPPLVSFLKSRRGYCQQFAGAMALMLRYVGVPARVAAGFTSGSYDAGKREWTVTDHNAHTWVEVYFPKFGWIPFDPTPDRGQLTAAYTPFSGAFDVREAAGLGGALLGVPEIRAQVDRAAELEQGGSGASGGDEDGGSGALAETGGSLLGLLVLVLAFACGAIVAVKEGRRRLRFLARDSRALAAAYRRDVLAFAADQGIDAPVSATAAELGDMISRKFAVDARPFVRAVTAARYGPPAESRAAVGRARLELRRLRRRMRRELSVLQRARGAVSLRSLAL